MVDEFYDAKAKVKAALPNDDLLALGVTGSLFIEMLDVVHNTNREYATAAFVLLLQQYSEVVCEVWKD